MPSLTETISLLAHRIEEAPEFLHALEGYTYGFPLVIMDVTRGSQCAVSNPGEYKAPINQFQHMTRFVSPDFKDVVRISRNSLWSTAFIDLSEGPFVFSHPDMKDRYFVVQTMNMWTDNFASVGSRNTGHKPSNFLVVGPDWNGSPPPDVKDVFRCSTRYAWMLIQIGANGPKDFDEIVELEHQLTLTPLSQWGRPYTPPSDVTVDPNVDTTITPYDQLRLMPGTEFFQRLARLLKENPPYHEDAPMMDKLRAIGVEPGKELDIENLAPHRADAMNRAALKVWSLFSMAPSQMPNVNGWILPLNLGRYGTDYQTRCVIAWLGLGALSAEDAIYPTAFTDASGAVLDGTKKYTMHFDSEDLFPSKSGVWSISAYRENFYIQNEVDRYAVAQWMPIKFNGDGSLDVYIQAQAPGDDKESNWLPTPPGSPFNLTIRVYAPEQPMLDGSYKIPPVQRV